MKKIIICRKCGRKHSVEEVTSDGSVLAEMNCASGEQLYPFKERNEGKLVVTTILFDSSAAKWVIDCFKRKYKMNCRFCGEKITKDNIAGVTHQGYVCNELPCIIEFTGDDNIMSLASQKQHEKTK